MFGLHLAVTEFWRVLPPAPGMNIEAFQQNNFLESVWNLTTDIIMLHTYTQKHSWVVNFPVSYPLLSQCFWVVQYKFILQTICVYFENDILMYILQKKCKCNELLCFIVKLCLNVIIHTVVWPLHIYVCRFIWKQLSSEWPVSFCVLVGPSENCENYQQCNIETNGLLCVKYWLSVCNTLWPNLLCKSCCSCFTGHTVVVYLWNVMRKSCYKCIIEVTLMLICSHLKQYYSELWRF